MLKIYNCVAIYPYHQCNSRCTLSRRREDWVVCIIKCAEHPAKYRKCCYSYRSSDQWTVYVCKLSFAARWSWLAVSIYLIDIHPQSIYRFQSGALIQKLKATVS
jgi:hypothetical protein